MSHKKFYVMVGLSSFGCGLLSLVSIWMNEWASNDTITISKMEFISLYAFGLSVWILLAMPFLSRLYGKKHVTGWKPWHALWIPVVEAAAAAVPWVPVLLHMRA